MRKSLGLVVVNLAIAGAASLSGCQSNNKVQAVREPVLSEPDKHFVMEAEKAGAQQSALGAFISGKSNNKQIKQYADLLVKHRSDALQKLGGIKNKYEMTESEPAPDVAAQFKGLSKRALDREFVKVVLRDQEKIITLFQQEAQSAADNDIREYAVLLLPTLQSDFKNGQDLETNFFGSARQARAAAGKRKAAHTAAF